jgi:plastocyanin
MTRPARLVSSALTLLALVTASLVSRSSATDTGTVSGHVKLMNAEGSGTRDPSNVVVLLENVPNADPKRLGVQRNARITQKDRRFLPDVAVVTAGGAVEFPNEDFIDHNVFSLSRPRLFDLGLYRNPETKSVTFNRPGVVDVYCNIHPDMAAKVKVMDTVHYAQPKKDGSFVLAGVPPGTYPIVAWQAHGEEYRGQVTVETGKTAKVELSLRAGTRSNVHTNKEGKPYGRYH